MRQFKFVLWLVLWAACGVVVATGQEGTECSLCHDQAERSQDSVHASVECATCHRQHEQYPHPSGIARSACADCHTEVAREDALGVHGQARSQGNVAAPDCGVCHGDVHEIQQPRSIAFRKAVPDTCGMCHNEVAQQFLGSVHGKALAQGIPDTPICTDCHGEHSILPHTHPESLVHRSHIRETCEQCHGDVRLSRRFHLPTDRVVSFEASFHGLAAKAGSQSVANCASCHGYHNILPSSDPASTIHPNNLPTTCGQCHPGAGRRFAIGQVHWLEGGQEPAGVRWVRNIYLVVIPVVIGFMLLHNLGDWIRKVSQLRLTTSALPKGTSAVLEENPGFREIRMHRFERIQHALLLVSFAVLVWTGFALKYPDQWWAHPLLLWESVFPVRATVHRIAGVVLIGVVLMHVISLFFNPTLRHHWHELWPKARDVSEALRGLAYSLCLRSSKPVLSAHSYIEKVEYWAVVWGTAVMMLTGVMLWAASFMLAWFPKSWLDVVTAIHFYEAVLAALAIVVWHLYSVIFDPEVYPMDTAWLTGLTVRKRPSHQPDEPSENTRASRNL